MKNIFKKKIPTESEIRRMKELEDLKEDYLKNYKNPITRFIMGLVRWHKIEALVFLLIVAGTIIFVLTVNYNKKEGLSIKSIDSNTIKELKK